MSDLILDTPVTWAAFESHLRLSLATQARPGANKSAIDIGDGNGFASRCTLINCDWIGTEKKENLPRRVVIKIPSTEPMRKLNDSLPPGQKQFADDNVLWEAIENYLREVHNIEVATYEFFSNFEALLVPKLYFGFPFGAEDQASGQLCIEYVEDSRMMSFFENYSVEQVIQIARAIGKIHACSIKKEVSAPELGGRIFESYYKHRTKMYSCMLKGMFAFDDSDKTKKLMSKIELLLPDYYDSNLSFTIHDQLGIRPVLVNGDLRTENVLLSNDGGELASLIDWQCTHFGVGVEDLHRISLFALTAEERRAHTPMLVEEMHNSLVENLDGVDAPYSLDMMQLLSEVLFPHCALFFAAGCVQLISNQEHDVRITDDEKARRREIALKKVLGSLEDVVVMENTNKQLQVTLDFRRN